MRKSLLDKRESRLNEDRGFVEWPAIRCGIRINDADVIFDILDYDPDISTELRFFLFFYVSRHQRDRQVLHRRSSTSETGKICRPEACEPVPADQACDTAQAD